MNVLLCLIWSSKRPSSLSRHPDGIKFIRLSSRLNWNCSLSHFIILSLRLPNMLQIDEIRILDSVESLRWRWYNYWSGYRERLDLLNFLKYLRSFIFKNLPEVLVHVGIIALRYFMRTNLAYFTFQNFTLLKFDIISLRIILAYLCQT
jgi:hypothetical protein